MNCKNTSKTRTKDKSFSKHKNIKHIKGYIQKQDYAYQTKADLLKNALVNVKKRKRLFEKGLQKIAKMQIFHKLNLIKLRKCGVYHEMSKNKKN